MAPGKVSIPPVLPPSVEEAYRRKCMELKQRSKEVEDVNDATKLRISRLKRQVDKLRVERAFLLEQLHKRTSANVEDSEGSPSPPPTPKEKPLRIKRGHRKPSILQNFEANPVAGSTFINQNLATLSPSSDAFSHHVEHKDGHHKDLPSSRSHPGPAANGLPSSNPLKEPKTAFELYADTLRDELKSKQDKQEPRDDDDDAPAVPITVEQELAKRWKELPDEEKQPFQDRERAELDNYQKEKDEKDEAAKSGSGSSEDKVAEAEAESGSKSTTDDKDVKDEPDADEDDNANAKSPSRGDTKASQDEDVEMTNYDSDQDPGDGDS